MNFFIGVIHAVSPIPQPARSSNRLRVGLVTTPRGLHPSTLVVFVFDKDEEVVVLEL